MKRITFICAAIMFLVGCASITFNPDTGVVEYTRIGDQHIRGFELIKSGDGDGGVTIKLKGQQSDADALTEAIKVISILSTK